MSDTPRTDAEIRRQEKWADAEKADTYDCWIETFAFARKLERELAAALASEAQLAKAMDGFVQRLQTIIAQKDP